MKKLIAPLIAATLVLLPAAAFCQVDLEKEPAYLPIDKVLDGTSIRPKVNVNLPRFLIKDALSGLKGSNSPSLDGIDLEDLIKDVKLIRVVVIEANDSNREALDKVARTLRKDLDKKWTALVSVPDDKGGGVGVYAMPDPSGESNAGLAVLVHDEGNLVIGNIVGPVSIGKLIKAATQSRKFPKEFLKNLQGLGSHTQAPEASKSGDGSNTNAAGGDSKATADNSSEK